MSKKCDVCGKHPMSGKSVSHAHNVNNRIFYPNLRTIRTTTENGAPRRMKICMKCLKAQAKTR